MKHKKIYKFLTCVLALIIAMSATSVVSFAAIWNGTASSVVPAQSNDGYYLLSSGEDLAWFADLVNSDAGNVAQKARLTDDIYLNDIENDSYSNKWTPIADYAENGRMFSGVFDGNGFTIYGLSIDNNKDYQGLFGYLSGAQIKNVKISSAKISAGSDVGTIAGYSDKSTEITSCIADGSVYGNANVGGITGYLINSSGIYNSSFSGSVNATGNRVGGITGCVAFQCVISQTYNTATVYSKGKFVGGIAGTNSGAQIISCYNMGKVSGDLRVAGICGNNVGDISCSYNASQVESISDPPGLIGAIAAYYYMANINNCYYDSNLYTGVEDNGTALETNEIKRRGFVDEINALGGNFYYDYLIANKGYPILSWQVDANLWDGTISQPKKSADGAYYYINNGRELAWFAGLVNGTLDGVKQDVHADAILMNSIVLNIGNIAEGSNVWTPIGDNGVEYSGEFVGNGFTVRGMYIPSGETVGLFGNVSATGQISNITVAESVISGTYCAGAIAAVNYGVIDRAKVIYTDVTASTTAGGIAGENGGEIVNSSSVYSNITSTENSGGIVGENFVDSVISTCCSSSTVTSKTNSGGISGKNSGEIKFSFNSGTITATDSYAGGISGRLIGSTINNCYNTGDITATSKVGGICGQLTERGKIELTYSVGTVNGGIDTNAILGGLTNGSVTNSYYDSLKSNLSDKYATALTTEKMTNTTALDNMTGFSRQYWAVTPDSEYFVHYPQLDSFATSGDFDLYDLSVDSVTYLKDGFVCKIIGGAETKYFTTLVDAINSIDENSAGIIELTESVTINETIEVKGDVTIVPTDDTITITRGKYFFETPFVVKSGAKLSFGADDVQYPTLALNGNNVTDVTNQKFPQSTIVVEQDAVLNIYDIISTNNRALNGGFVSNSGEVNFYGGILSDNVAVENGGVIYNTGTVNIFATEMLNNNSKLAGGAIYNANGQININTGADIHNNTSGEGGMVYAYRGKINVLGGSVYANSASYGGAVYLANNATLNLHDGTIYENTAVVNGSAVYTTGSVMFYAGGNVDSSNDIYLPVGKTVTMQAKSLYASTIATLTPESYSEGLRVISGEYTAMNASLCNITPDGETLWRINSGGRLTTNEIKYVLTASYFNADAVEYTSLEEAMEDIGDSPAIITLTDDIVVEKTVVIKSNVSFESDGNPRTISLKPGVEGPMFEVINGAELSLGTSVDKQTTDVLFIDGTNVKGETIIDVKDGAVKIYSGTVIYGANELDSAIKSVDTVEMHGGKVTENNVKIGAIHIADGKFNLFEGTIFDNTDIGVYSNGTFTIYDGAYVDESNLVYLTDGHVINVSKPEPIYDEETGEEIDQGIVIPNLIAVVDFEKHYVDKSIISSEESDISKYSGKFSVNDSNFTLDENNILRCEGFKLINNSALLINENCVYRFSIDTYTVKAAALQFENENLIITYSDGTVKSNDKKIGTGDRVVLLDQKGVPYKEVEILIYGDIDSNGDVNGNDAFIATMYLYGFYKPEDFSYAQLEAMDVNHDGTVTQEDVDIIENMGVFIGGITQVK